MAGEQTRIAELSRLLAEKTEACEAAEDERDAYRNQLTEAGRVVQVSTDAADAAAAAVGATAARLSEALTERNRLREVLAGIVFFLGPASSPRDGRDPADGDGVVAYSYVPGLVAAIAAERNELRAVVEATRKFIAAQVDADSTPDQDAAAWNAMIDAFHQLDGNAEITDG